MDLTIQELAKRVDMTPRNIREWQTIGVLPPPQRRGRVGFYDEAHVNRIERIKSLRADGFPLDVIRQFLDRSELSAADVHLLTAALLDPLSHSGTKTLTRAELAKQLGAEAEQHLLQGGLIEEAADDHLLVKDVATFEYVEKLSAIGLPVDAIAAVIEAMTEHQIRGVQTLVDLYSEVVWQPFVAAGLPAAEWSSIAVKSGQVRELVIGLGGQTLRRAADIVIAQIAVREANRLDSRS